MAQPRIFRELDEERPQHAIPIEGERAITEGPGTAIIVLKE
jgi:hypothetical protein